MIRFACPECGAKIRATEELAGQRGRCPECRQGVPIPRDELFVAVPKKPLDDADAIAFDESDEAPAAEIVQEERGEGLASHAPETLSRYNHYLICNSKDVIATWEEDGKGWMVRVKDGFVKATQNPGQLPSMGNYVFIEIDIHVEGPTKKLSGVHSFELPGAYCLSRLAKSDNAILEMLETSAELNDRQIALVKQRINAKFLPSIWEGAEGII